MKAKHRTTRSHGRKHINSTRGPLRDASDQTDATERERWLRIEDFWAGRTPARQHRWAVAA